MSVEPQGPSMESVGAYYQSLEPYWHPVMPSNGLSDGPAPAELLGRRIVLARLGGHPVAFEDLCRHLGAALSMGRVLDRRLLRCAYHGWTYDARGQCVDIPARRGHPIPAGARVRSYKVVEAYGLVWVCLADRPSKELPLFPEYDDPDFHKMELRTYHPWQASLPRIMMSNLDDTHFAWVHPGILGDEEHPEPPDHHTHCEGEIVINSYAFTHSPELSSPVHTTGQAGTITNHTGINTMRLVNDSPSGRRTLWIAVCPVTHNRSLVFLREARNFQRDPTVDSEVAQLLDLIQSQDRPIIEGQRPWLLPPLSSRLILYIRPADQPLIEYQKLLQELGVPQL